MSQSMDKENQVIRYEPKPLLPWAELKAKLRKQVGAKTPQRTPQNLIQTTSCQNH